MTTVALDAAGAAFIAGFEGGQSADGRYYAYYDPYGHIETIGIGETRINGQPVRPGTVWTREQAYADLYHRFNAEFAPALAALGVELNPNEIAGYGSFIWNEGAGAARWDVGRYLKAGNRLAAANALLAYNRADGVVVQALVTRRRAERARVLTPYTPPAPADPHHYQRFETVDRDLGDGRHGNERQLVQEYDRERQHWLKFPGRLKVLRQDLGLLAARLDGIIAENPKAAGEFDREWRRDQLRGRANGRRYV